MDLPCPQPSSRSFWLLLTSRPPHSSHSVTPALQPELPLSLPDLNALCRSLTYPACASSTPPCPRPSPARMRRRASGRVPHWRCPMERPMAWSQGRASCMGKQVGGPSPRPHSGHICAPGPLQPRPTRMQQSYDRAECVMQQSHGRAERVNVCQCVGSCVPCGSIYGRLYLCVCVCL